MFGVDTSELILIAVLALIFIGAMAPIGLTVYAANVAQGHGCTVSNGVLDPCRVVQIGIRGLVGALYLQDLAHKVRRGMAGSLPLAPGLPGTSTIRLGARLPNIGPIPGVAPTVT